MRYRLCDFPEFFSDVPNAGFISENRCFDKNTSCINGACDPMVGKCVCPRRMRAIRLKGGNEEDMRCVFSKLVPETNH